MRQFKGSNPFDDIISRANSELLKLDDTLSIEKLTSLDSGGTEFRTSKFGARNHSIQQWLNMDLTNHLKFFDTLNGSTFVAFDMLGEAALGKDGFEIVQGIVTGQEKHRTWRAVYQDVLERLDGKKVSDVISALADGKVSKGLVEEFVRLKAFHNPTEVEAICLGYSDLADQARAAWAELMGG